MGKMFSQAFFIVNLLLVLGAFFIWKRMRNRLPKTQISTKKIFMYNGHHFNAYEVLGLEPGCSKKMIEKKRLEIENLDSSDKPFLEAALMALKK